MACAIKQGRGKPRGYIIVVSLLCFYHAVLSLCTLAFKLNHLFSGPYSNITSPHYIETNQDTSMVCITKTQETSLDDVVHTQITYTIDAPGEFLDGGATGLVTQISPDKVVKTPWNNAETELCQYEMEIEPKVYETNGPHEYSIPYFGFDPSTKQITIAYMPNGTPRNYLQQHSDTGRISDPQRQKRTLQVAEALSVLHANKILHCDFSPRNVLLDEHLDAKFADFGCASINGSLSEAGGSMRYSRPGRCNPPGIVDTVFALGCIIYEIGTGKAPYADVETDRIQRLYSLQQMPDLHLVPLQYIIPVSYTHLTLPTIYSV